MTVFVNLMNELNKTKQNAELDLLSGHITDFAAYKFGIGQIKGLEIAIEICNDIFKRSAKENEF